MISISGFVRILRPWTQAFGFPMLMMISPDVHRISGHMKPAVHSPTMGRGRKQSSEVQDHRDRAKKEDQLQF